MDRTRANQLTLSQLKRLRIASAVIADTFGEPVYLVGSSILRRDFRDVDLRVILPDDRYSALPFKVRGLLAFSVSLYLEQSSGLPIDFQLQCQSESDGFDGERQPVALPR